MVTVFADVTVTVAGPQTPLPPDPAEEPVWGEFGCDWSDAPAPLMRVVSGRGTTVMIEEMVTGPEPPEPAPEAVGVAAPDVLFPAGKGAVEPAVP